MGSAIPAIKLFSAALHDLEPRPKTRGGTYLIAKQV